MRDKVRDRQADRIIVNLERSEFATDALRQHLARTAPSGLREVLAIKHGVITRVWP
jgi:hypothetical protein